MYPCPSTGKRDDNETNERTNDASLIICCATPREFKCSYSPSLRTSAIRAQTLRGKPQHPTSHIPHPTSHIPHPTSSHDPNSRSHNSFKSTSTTNPNHIISNRSVSHCSRVIER
ncbi:hypothetical protein BS17DRAFT_776884 [Gyrodon lividus]|nr:hypothetical protein BS17DRAFT_776884 [Gyrodon lividus]